MTQGLTLQGWFRPNWSMLRVVGPDAGSFLQNLSTNDIKLLQIGAACESLFTNVKAKVMAHAVVGRVAESDYAVVVTSPRAAQLAEHLDKYHIREDLTLDVQQGLLPCLAWFQPPQDSRQGFLVPALQAWLTIEDQHPGSGSPIAADDFHAFRIQRRFPLDGLDVDERNLPQELSRDAALISFDKGCYLGQETVARIDALGHVNQLLVILKAETNAELSVGHSLRAGDREVGRVTSVSPSAKVSLAYVRREHAEPGSKLVSEHGGTCVVA